MQAEDSIYETSLNTRNWKILKAQKRSLSARLTSEMKIESLKNEAFMKKASFKNTNWKLPKIRPHRFGGEGVLIGVQTATLNAQVTFVNIAVAISALAGGPKNDFAPSPELGGVCVIFGRFLDRTVRECWTGIWARFGSLPSPKKRDKHEKTW